MMGVFFCGWCILVSLSIRKKIIIIIKRLFAMRIGILCLSPRGFVNVSSVSLGTRARTCYVTVLVM